MCDSTPSWKIGDRVYFYLANNKYYGHIIDSDLNNGLYKVKFISSIRNENTIFAQEWVKIQEIKSYRIRTNTFLFNGDLAEFLTESNGLKFGIVLDFYTKGEDDWCDFGYYKISPSRKIEYSIEKNVHRSRVTFISNSENEFKILPIKKGSKVEFNSLFSGRTTGKICDIYGGYDLPLFSIKYNYINDFGEKEYEIDDDVTLDDIYFIK